MIELIKNHIKFIAWENFISIDVYAQWSIALLLIMCFGFISYTLSFLFGGITRKLFHNHFEEFTIRTAIGMAVISFILSFMGLLSVLYDWLFFLLLFILFIVSVLKANYKAFKWIFVRYKILWLLFIIISVASLLPPLWFDETTYHLVYPMKWAKQHQIFADSSMKFPLYTFSFHVFHVISYWLDKYELSHLLSWYCGVLAFFGIIGLLRRLQVQRFFQYLAAFAFFFTPVVQQYLNIGYHDVPLMLFMFLSVYVLVLFSTDEINALAQIALALIPAMFVGMKNANAFFVPLIILWALLNFHQRKTLPFILSFCILGSLWYIRNLLIAGDPIPPSLNILLGHEDLFWSLADYNYQMNDIKPKHNWGWRIIYMLPYELTHSRHNSPLRYWPLLSYVVFIPFLPFAFWKNRQNRALRTIFIVTIFAVILWLSLSYFTRYAHFLALLVCCSAIIVDNFFKKYLTDANQYVQLFFILVFVYLFLGPRHYAFSYFKNNFNKKVPTTQVEVNNFVGWNDPTVMNLLNDADKYGVEKGDTIYFYGLTQYKYYFEKNDYHVVGDGVNRFRFGDFVKAVKTDAILHFLKEAKARYVLIDRKFLGTLKEEDFSDLTLLYGDNKLYLFARE